MSHSRPRAPCKGSNERKEVETILFNRRLSRGFAEKVEKSLDSMSKQTDITIGYEMKKILEAQAKLNNRIADLKEQQRLDRWSSLPRIDEKSEVWCVDPYPVTFQTTRPVKLPGGGKMYPVRQRRKSMEFEDLPLLAFKTQHYSSPTTSPATRRHMKIKNTKEQQTHNHHSRSLEALHDQPQPIQPAEQFKTKPPTSVSHNSSQKSTSPSLRKAKLAKATKYGNALVQNSSSSTKENFPSTNSHGSALPSLMDRLTVPTVEASIADKFSVLDKRTILNSPLSKRKLNSILKEKESLIQANSDVM